jgi:hypothetical protein
MIAGTTLPNLTTRLFAFLGFWYYYYNALASPSFFRLDMTDMPWNLLFKLRQYTFFVLNINMSNMKSSRANPWSLASPRNSSVLWEAFHLRRIYLLYLYAIRRGYVLWTLPSACWCSQWASPRFVLRVSILVHLMIDIEVEDILVYRQPGPRFYSKSRELIWFNRSRPYRVTKDIIQREVKNKLTR